MKAIAKMKLGNEQTMKLEQLLEVGSDCEFNSWLDGQSVRESGRNSVVVGSNPTQSNFL